MRESLFVAFRFHACLLRSRRRRSRAWGMRHLQTLVPCTTKTCSHGCCFGKCRKIALDGFYVLNLDAKILRDNAKVKMFFLYILL